MKRAVATSALLLAIACVAGRADDSAQRAASVAPVPSAAPTDRILLVTGTLAGNLEPCHCTEGMLGGIPRRASLVAKFGARLPLIELGDLDKPSETVDSIMELRERGALEALATVSGGSLHAIALGCTDARLGLERLEKLATECAPGITWLCANLRGGPAFVKPSVDVGDIIITALLDPALVGGLDRGELIAPRDGLAPLLARKKPLVILFHGEPKAAEAMLGDVPGIDIIISGHVEHEAPPRALRAGATLLTLEQNGQRLHALALGAGGRLHARASHPLDGLLPDAQAAREALDRFYERATKIAPDLPKQKVEVEGGKFVGSSSCRDCHKEAYEVWKKTPHSHALATLREKEARRSGLPECVVCHVTGYGFETGWAPKTSAPELSAVGCESCHGPGSNHVERAFANEKDAVGYGRPPGEDRPARWRTRCILCHDPLNSPAFEVVSYLDKIKHWDAKGK